MPGCRVRLLLDGGAGISIHNKTGDTPAEAVKKEGLSNSVALFAP